MGEKVEARISHLRIGEAVLNGYHQIQIDAGHRGRTRIVPPAGEQHAFFVEGWARRVTVSVSPTGRSVRVWVDGQEIPRGAADSAQDATQP